LSTNNSIDRFVAEPIDSLLDKALEMNAEPSGKSLSGTSPGLQSRLTALQRNQNVMEARGASRKIQPRIRGPDQRRDANLLLTSTPKIHYFFWITEILEDFGLGRPAAAAAGNPRPGDLASCLSAMEMV
jgi:hypothetical protein